MYLDVAHKQDAAQVLALLRLLQVESDTFTISPEFATLTVDSEAHNIDQISQTTDHLILLAWLADEPIGIATISRVAHSEFGELGIAVRKPYWHQGLGTALLDETLNWAGHYSTLAGLVLEVFASNTHAITLYQKAGFNVVAQTQIVRQHHLVPALKMQLKIET